MVDSRAIVDQREVVSKVSKEICRDSEVSSGSVFEVSSGKDLEVQLDLNSNKVDSSGSPNSEEFSSIQVVEFAEEGELLVS
ncbi:hypothetical protein ACOSQ3_009931 [Xanthoceras sorbifolium]